MKRQSQYRLVVLPNQFLERAMIAFLRLADQIRVVYAT
jgi:hypothetical protein